MNNMIELELNELENVSGGVLPVAVVVGLKIAGGVASLAAGAGAGYWFARTFG